MRQLYRLQQKQLGWNAFMTYLQWREHNTTVYFSQAYRGNMWHVRSRHDPVALFITTSYSSPAKQCWLLQLMYLMDSIQNRISVISIINPLTAGVAHIRVFIFY